jgi:hypothetical protein
MSDGTARATCADRRPDKTKLTFWKPFLRQFSLRRGRPGGVNRGQSSLVVRVRYPNVRRDLARLGELIAADFPLAK